VENAQKTNTEKCATPVILPQDTLTYGEVHAIIQQHVQRHGTPEILIHNYRGHHEKLYGDFFGSVPKAFSQKSAVGGGVVTLNSSAIFPYDEFSIRYDDGNELEFVTPTIQKMRNASV